MKIKLHKIELDHTKGYAWACGFGPLETGMPFLSLAEASNSARFWEVNPMPPGLRIDPGGRKWPDFLGHGGGKPSFFVSERVIESLNAIKAPLGRLTHMPIAVINAKALRNKPTPKYFVVETIPGIEVDLVATGFQVDAQGKAILIPRPNPWPRPYRYRMDSWNGSDIFAPRDIGPTDGPYTEMFCTVRVKELAEREGWTNVRFTHLTPPWM